MVALSAPLAVVFAQVLPPLVLICHWYAMVRQHPGLPCVKGAAKNL